jgi:uncharacterized protein GlcG (DUF336 family)
MGDITPETGGYVDVGRLCRLSAAHQRRSVPADRPVALLAATVVGCGLPIRVDGELVGGIGVGGGIIEQDVACAQAGLDVLSAA